MNRPALLFPQAVAAFFVTLGRAISSPDRMLSSNNPQPVPYPDLVFRLLGSLVVSYLVDAVARTESLFDRLGNATFYIDLFGGFGMVLLVWHVIRYVVIRLDRWLDWFGQTALRLGVQLVAG